MRLSAALPFLLFSALPARAQVSSPSHVVVLQHDGTSYARNLNGLPNVAPRQRAAALFYANHRDAYDFLVVFPAFETNFGREVMGLNNLVKNDVAGVGLPIIDESNYYGSAGRLRAYLDIGSLMPGAADSSVAGALGVLAHEVEHGWGTEVRFRDPASGILSDGLLGLERSHRSFFLDSDASVLFGARWRDNGNGTFTSGGVTSGGVPEIVTDPLPSQQVWSTPVTPPPTPAF
jgi:hypothetical protein